VPVLEVTNRMVIQEVTRSWCQFPYPGHPKGCPNYGIRDDCPPKASLVGDYFDLSQPHWFLLEEFDLLAHANKMKQKHPEWSERQCRCCLYWQGSVRKRLRETCRQFEHSHPGTVSVTCPEAMGVNVFRTCHRHGVSMKKNPQGIVYKVALAGYLRANTNRCRHALQFVLE